MKGADCGCAAPRPKAAPLVVYPSWMDGLYQVRTSRAIPPRVVTLDANGEAKIEANALRWMIAFTNAVNPVTPSDVGTHPRPDVYPLARLVSGTTARFTLFEWGAYVVGEWYIRGTALDTVLVSECVLY